MNDAISLLLYTILSGDVLFIGLALMAVGLVCACRFKRSSVLVWAGLILAVFSGVPLHPVAYVLLVVCAVTWGLVPQRILDRRMTVLAALIVTSGVGILELSPRNSGRRMTGAGSPVVVIGDSLSAGIGGPSELTWPMALADKSKLNVINLARAGATLRDGLKEAGKVPKGPVIVLVELGGNDLLGGTTRKQYAKDLEALLKGMVSEDRRVIMFELPLLPFQNSFGRIQRRLCHEYGVVLIPRSMLAGAVALPGHTTDGLHLSAKGHSWLAEKVRDWMGLLPQD